MDASELNYNATGAAANALLVLSGVPDHNAKPDLSRFRLLVPTDASFDSLVQNVRNVFCPGGAVRARDALMATAAVRSEGMPDNVFASHLVSNKPSGSGRTEALTLAYDFVALVLQQALGVVVTYTPKPNRTSYLINFQLHGSSASWPKVTGAWLDGASLRHSDKLLARDGELFWPDLTRPVVIGRKNGAHLVTPRVFKIVGKGVPAILHDSFMVSPKTPPQKKYPKRKREREEEENPAQV